MAAKNPSALIAGMAETFLANPEILSKMLNSHPEILKNLLAGDSGADVLRTILSQVRVR